MRISKLKNLFSYSKYKKLRNDFSSPWRALLASSGLFKTKWNLHTKQGHEFVTDRSDLPAWKEYFNSIDCKVEISADRFHVIPHDNSVPDYYIKGANQCFTSQPQRWVKNNNPPIIDELEKAEQSFYSQHGEDGVLEYLMNRIPNKNSFIVEFGAYDGICMSNSRYWIHNHGWSAYLIEADDRFYRDLEKLYQHESRVKIEHTMVTEDNINQLFHNAQVPYDFEILSIDIDSIDYYIWKAITEFVPRIVVIEYNAAIPPDVEYVIAKDKVAVYAGTEKEGASILSFYKLAREKNYHLVYAELSGANLFFVHDSCIEYLDNLDLTPAQIYQAPQFGVLAGGAAPNGRGYLLTKK